MAIPMKIRVPTKLGFKNPKYVVSMEVTNDYKGGYLGRPGLQFVQRELSDRLIFSPPPAQRWSGRGWGVYRA